MPFTYMLLCGDGSTYVGSTWDLDERLSQHASGRGATYTRRRLPVSLLWSTEFDRIDEAWAMEKRVQGWGRAKRFALAEGRFGDLPGLSVNRQPPEPEAPADGSRQARPADGGGPSDD